MSALFAIERAHDRVRLIKNGPRTLDLDILLFGDLCIDLPDITTPHPRAHERAFVLLPLLEVAPGLTIPGKGAARDFLATVSGQSVHRIAEMESHLQ
jgi:2-amino-4-hydroxy-6-hydroxymethyldihydropteridine diphosphokinase